MIILGVTGSIGMGKTEAGKYFIKNKIDVFDCDKEIATFYNKNDTITELKKTFPSTVYNNKVDKNALENIVFNDKKKLNFLEELLYKKLQAKQSFWLRKKIREKKNLLVFDVPLLFEKDNIKKYDIVLVLSCNKALQRRRVLKRQGWNEERYEKTLKEQIPDYIKQSLADVIIKSDRGKRQLNQEIIKIIKELKNTKGTLVLDIVGEGSLLESLQKLADENSVEVNFLGVVNNENLMSMYQQYKFYISTSEFDCRRPQPQYPWSQDITHGQHRRLLRNGHFPLHQRSHQHHRHPQASCRRSLCLESESLCQAPPATHHRTLKDHRHRMCHLMPLRR